MNKTSKMSFRKKFVLWFWGLFAAGSLALVLLFVGILHGWIGYLPPLEELQNPKNRYASEIYSEDLVVLGHFFVSENRVGVQYADLPEDLVHALVATEDARFYDHSGIDFRALSRVLFTLGRKGGGSTITQQLAKQIWSKRVTSKFQRALQKPIEWVIAIELERLYSKDEIVNMYFNQFDFLNNAVGIQSAAHVYFGKAPIELNTEECATLVGMCQNPCKYNPRRHAELCTQRRNVVLSQMAKYDYITKEERDSLMALPLEIHFHRADHKEGLAPYFREMLRQELTKDGGLLEDLRKPDGGRYDIYRDGLKIYTTLDSRMQQYAEEAVLEQMKVMQKLFLSEKRTSTQMPFDSDTSPEEVQAALRRAMRDSERYRGMKRDGASESEIEAAFNTPTEMQVFSYNGAIDTTMTPMDSIRWNLSFLRCGFMAIDPHTGHVKAYVGGPNFSLSQVDMARQDPRQVGSAIKPYLFTLAMENGMWPCETIVNGPVIFNLPEGGTWDPKPGHSDVAGQAVSLTSALAQSSNWITAYLMKRFGPQPLADLMRSFGITVKEEDIVPSLCLGTPDVSVEQMADAYTTFVNRGIRTEPIYITRIEDRDGNILATFTPKTHEVINEVTAYKMIHMLRSVVDHGTGMRLRSYVSMPLGGKTGTTTNNADGWFVGFTPDIVGATWVGGANKHIHFANMANGQGAHSALPVFGLFLKKVYSDPLLGYETGRGFDIPDWFDPNEGCR